MAEKTAIEWTHHTWSPWEGCTKVSPACDHCYAAGMNRWLRKGVNWGPGAPRREYSEAHWAKPLLWNAKAADAGVRRRVFPSVCDPFDNEVPAAWRARFFALIAATPNLDWLLLTKRIGNAGRMIAEAIHPAGITWPWPNVWLGATVVTQEEADRDVPKLLAVPARVRFLSVEPMLGPVDLTNIRVPLAGESYTEGNVLVHKSELDRGAPRPSIDWVICGGESGPGARPMHPDWARSLRDQCASAGVPFLFKQWGEWVPYEESAQPPYYHSQHGHELDGHALPDFESDDGRAQREWHCDFLDMLLARRVGKAAAGRLLEGVEHNGFPSAS